MRCGPIADTMKTNETIPDSLFLSDSEYISYKWRRLKKYLSVPKHESLPIELPWWRSLVEQSNDIVAVIHKYYSAHTVRLCAVLE